MTQHSILPPSSAARRVACPGSRSLEAQYPQEDSEASREGTAAHWVASELLKNEVWARETWSLSRLLVDEKLPELPETLTFNGVAITQEMIDGANLYVHRIKALCKFELAGNKIKIEERVDIGRIHAQCWGTPDCWALSAGTLYIFDYKFGYGQVDVFENWQLIEYAAGILEHCEARGEGIVRHVQMCIVQPRGFHRDGPVRTWNVTVETLRGYFDILEDAEAEAMKPDALCKPSPECTDCAGRHACEALQTASLRTVDLLGSNVPHALPPEALGSELRLLKHSAKLLDARITGLEAEAEAQLRSGKRIPYFMLGESVSRKRWTKPADEIVKLGELLEIDLTKPQEVITPTQAFKKGVPESLLATFSETPRGGMKLIADDGKQARKLFGQSQETV